MKKKSNWGGFRKGAGRTGRSRIGGTIKKCISVGQENWDTALSIWNETPSRLVDDLLVRYNRSNGSILQTEAAI